MSGVTRDFFNWPDRCLDESRSGVDVFFFFFFFAMIVERCSARETQFLKLT
jgi:hypothetical protein